MKHSLAAALVELGHEVDDHESGYAVDGQAFDVMLQAAAEKLNQ